MVKEKEIIELIKNSKEPISTSKIANYLSSNYYTVKRILEDFENRRIIERISLGRINYWVIKDLGD